SPRLEFLVLGVGRLVDRGGIVDGVDALQQRNEIGVGIAQAPDLERVAVDVVDAQEILADADHAEQPQLRACALEALHGRVEPTGTILMHGQGGTRHRAGSGSGLWWSRIDILRASMVAKKGLQDNSF